MSSKNFIESFEEMEKILKNENLGFLGLSMDDAPYNVPMNYVYVKGTILFHCALMGKKLDFIKTNPRVCFTVARQAGKIVRHPQGALCHVENDSVICYGIARIIEDLEERTIALNSFNHCLQPDADEIMPDVASKCYAVEIKITEMTGREQREGKHTYWKYRFYK